ncbi:MAG: rod shape-determining protein [Oscillospiraceae bacterium]|nr:rod shape-determining protein [Oscillospiraceae bacterium]
MSFLSKDLGIDLGTANVVIYAEGKGIVLREPAVVAVDKNTGKVLKVGAAARNMLGRTPGNVVALRPMQDGVVSDYEMTQKMLTEFFRTISRFSFVKPRVIISVPCGVTSIEERAVVQIALEAGARRVYLIEESLAAALGANLSFSGPDGHMVVDIGGGTTDIGVLTMNGIAQSASIKVAGSAFDEAIIRYLRKKYGLLVGQTTAEDAKILVGSVFERGEPVVTKIKGRDFKTGLAREMMISSSDMVEALRRPARQITDEILYVLEQTTPELVADIARNGIVLTGGGSQIWGMDKLITDRTGISCTVADDADSCVAYGCGKSLGWINRMMEGPINFARRKLLKE